MLDIHSLFELNDQQAAAARQLDRDVIVTAGAGSGKTRTLVARYLLLLDAGHSPRHLAAITFTRKAAREMRNRVRQDLLRLRVKDSGRRERWEALEREMDSARIGTIHSLCEEILRNHPAQARLDPEFTVLDEGQTAALRFQSVEESLQRAAQSPDFRPLFEAFEVRSLERLLHLTLEKRLELAEWLAASQESDPNRAVLAHLEHTFCRREAVQTILDELRHLRDGGDLAADAGDRLAGQVKVLLEHWEAVEAALNAGDLPSLLAALHAARKEGMDLRAGKRSSRCKAALRDLRDIYAESVEGWLKEPDPQAESAWIEVLPHLANFFRFALELYEGRLEERRALDFDALEAGAMRLLNQPAVRRRWQAEIRALLVDEFQDTNQRQRAILEALSGGQPGKLFLVGDARQSIYRFRGADVTVFRAMEREIGSGGGAVQTIETTFRAHRDLLEAAGDLLATAMRPDREEPPPYWVSFSPLSAHRDAGCQGTRPPHIEFLIGSGEDSTSARRAAAGALAQRLLALKSDGQIRSWEEVGLLFRASTNFGIYEDALERAAIPYVTVAGRGFYDRPEIRDLLNLLQALSDPWDDLAMSGLLRSPAFGLSDETLYRLRWPNGREGQPAALHRALQGSLQHLPEDERRRAQRAADFLSEMAPLADRLPVAVLLKRVIDFCDLRAILGGGPLSEGSPGNGSRLWRNLDKLLSDAHSSGLVRVRAFLEYLQTLRDVDVREGEAAADVEGALQLMTIHKSKGLEFPLVVLADSGYRPPNSPQPAYLLPEVGLAVNPDRYEAKPAAYLMSHWLDGHQSSAEEKRLLYVALTRAREKALVSGHVGRSPSGWLKQLAQAAGLDLAAASAHPGPRQTGALPGGQPYAWQVLNEQLLETGRDTSPQPARQATALPHLGEGSAIYAPPIVGTGVDAALESREEGGPERQDWRATGSRRAPARVVGDLVHRALQHWRLPPDSNLKRLLESNALQGGLIDPGRQLDAVRRAEILLKRFAEHPIRAEIEAAEARRHEFPYVRQASGKIEWGAIDLLYRTSAGWRLLDFKTEELEDEAALERAVNEYGSQLQRYAEAVTSLLGETPRTALCLLDAAGQVRIVS